jgi:membrane-associated phospholipid phosphatase
LPPIACPWSSSPSGRYTLSRRGRAQFVWIGLALAGAGLPATVHAQAEGPPPPSESSSAAPRFHDFPRALGINFTSGLLSGENFTPLILGSAASLFVSAFDDDITDAVRDQGGESGEFGYKIGSPTAIGIATGTMIAVSPLVESERFRALAFSAGQAFVLGQVLTEVLKAAADRPRPNGSNNRSFPSGHASASFGLATVVSHYYGRKFGIPAYLFASFVGVSRIEHGGHFASDAALGATVGVIAGLTAVRTSDALATRRLTVVPAVTPNEIAVAFSWNLR